MKNNLPHELLSAWHDGEASPRERREVERLLDASSEARRELDEIAELSELLRSTPRASAPGELAGAIMQRIERETLIPAAPAAGSTGRLRGWVVTLGSLAATAAVIFLMVYAFDGGERRDSSLAEADRQPGAGADLEKRLDRDRAVSKDRAAGAGQVVRNDSEVPSGARLPRHLKYSPADREGVAEPISPLRSAAPPEAAGPPAAAMRDAEVGGAVNRQLAELKWEQVRIGDVIPYFRVPGDRTAVVEVTVVDVQKGVGAMQVLLQKNAVRAVDADDAPKDAAADEQLAAEPRMREQKAHGLYAIYVESTEDQLAETLEQFGREGHLVALNLKPPVSLDQVEIAAADRRALSFASGEDRPVVAPRPEEPASSESFQLLVSVPPEVLGLQMRRPAPQRRSTAGGKLLARAEPDRSKAEARRGLPVRVMFVFHARPPGK